MMPTVFITGATSGFGEACARRFAAAGWSLVLTGRRAERLHALADELCAQARILPLVVDVRDRSAMEQAIEQLPAEFTTLRGLINNAGLAAASAIPSGTGWQALLMLPALLLGLWLGQQLFVRIQAEQAARFTQWLLLVLAGVGLLGRAWP